MVQGSRPRRRRSARARRSTAGRRSRERGRRCPEPRWWRPPPPRRAPDGEVDRAGAGPYRWPARSPSRWPPPPADAARPVDRSPLGADRKPATAPPAEPAALQLLDERLALPVGQRPPTLEVLVQPDRSPEAATPASRRTLPDGAATGGRTGPGRRYRATRATSRDAGGVTGPGHGAGQGTRVGAVEGECQGLRVGGGHRGHHGVAVQRGDRPAVGAEDHRARGHGDPTTPGGVPSRITVSGVDEGS